MIEISLYINKDTSKYYPKFTRVFGRILEAEDFRYTIFGYRFDNLKSLMAFGLSFSLFRINLKLQIVKRKNHYPYEE